MLPIFLKTDHVLWFFSTCAQTFASLVGVFGMFVVFRLQVEEGRVGALRERMIHFDESHRLLPFESVIRELKRRGDEHRLRDELEHSQTIVTLLADYHGALAQRSWLSRAAQRPLIVLVFLVFWTLLLIAAYPLYVAHPIITVFVVWATVLGGGWPLFDVAHIVLLSIRTD